MFDAESEADEPAAEMQVDAVQVSKWGRGTFAAVV